MKLGFHDKSESMIGKKLIVKKKNLNNKLIFIIIDLVLTVCACLAVRTILSIQNTETLRFHYATSHADTRNIAQLFHNTEGEKFTSTKSFTQVFENQEVSFSVNEIDFKREVLRFDPFNLRTKFVLDRIDLLYKDRVVFSVEGESLKGYVSKTGGIKKKFKSDGLHCKSKNDDPRIYLSKTFSDKINRYRFAVCKAPFLAMIILFIILIIVQIKTLTDETDVEHKKRGVISFTFAVIILELGTICNYVVSFFESHFGQTPIGQIIYHLHTPLEGTDVSSYNSDIAKGVGIAAAVLAVAVVTFIILRRKGCHPGFTLSVAMLGVVLIFAACFKAISHYGIVEYYKYTHESTMLYEDNYVDGRDVTITFPERKRNLIYIFIESMELTFADSMFGGAEQVSMIPNLTLLAQENVCFSDGDSLNGAHQVNGATYTMGGMAAQTAGVPINEALVSNETLNGTWESENNYLPGVWTIGDILKEQGYEQEILIGSNGGFAGRSSYFKGHGDYEIADYPAAKEQGRIPPDYKVWWGFEDEKLFAFAKEDAMRLAQGDKPFNLTLLTVDTHATGGYKCDLCGDEFGNQYSNVIACSDRQVADFVRWVQEQDFYENTTIVLCGDHLTPDSMYIGDIGAAGFDRRTYTAFINPVVDGRVLSGEDYKGMRSFTTLDMFPTTLAAMDVKIEGDKLGLGVNLFSDEQTLLERFGGEYLNTELMKNSELYNKKLLYK